MALSSPVHTCSPFGNTAPVGFIIPINDDKLIYTTTCQETHCAITNIYLSTDNLASGELRYSNAPCVYGNSGITNLYAYNDSEFTYCLYENAYMKQYYTQNTFNTRVTAGGACGAALAISPNYVFGTAGSYIFRTDKMGAQSTYSYFPMYGITGKLIFKNDSVGFALGKFTSSSSKTMLIRIANSGFSWTPALIDSVDPIINYDISPQGNIYLLKKSGAVLKSANNGVNFSPLISAPAGMYTCMRFANDLTGFIGGTGGVLFKTADGGNSWTVETSNTNQDIRSIYTFNYSAYFVDASKKVYRSQQPLGVFENNHANVTLSIYPNPASGLVTVKYNYKTANELKVEVVDALGKKLMENCLTNELALDISDLSNGIYFIRVYENKNLLKTEKLLVTN